MRKPKYLPQLYRENILNLLWYFYVAKSGIKLLVDDE